MRLNTQNLIEYAYYYAPDGVVYALFGAGWLLRWQGLGTVEVNYLRDSGPFQDGSTVRDWRLPERVVDMQVFVPGSCRQDFYNAFAALNNALRPNRSATAQAGRLLFVLPDGREREIFAHILNGPQLDWDARGGTMPADLLTDLRFLCPDPIWRDPTRQVASFDLTLEKNLVFYESPSYTNRAVFPITFGTNTASEVQNVVYTGTYYSFPRIEIIGPIDQPRVQNATTGAVIELNYTIAAGASVIIDLNTDNQGIKTVVGSDGTNLIGTVVNPNDLATFRLEPDPIAPDGVNVLVVSGENGSNDTRVDVSYYTRYLGVPL